jgi:lipid II:glycine glycyltransferase (peptidoglycan interpeptide bridge formation enzyme)
MLIRIVEDTFDKKKYNSIALNPLQSWEWGEARKKMGIEVLRIGEFSKDQLENVYQLTFHKIPYIDFKIGYLPRSAWPSRKIFEFLYHYGKKNNLIFIKVEPYVQKSQITNHKSQKNFKFQISNFKLIPSPHPLFPEWTQIIDLKKSEEELLEHMHHKTRYNIRLAQKKGVVVKEMSDSKGFEIFFKLYFETCRRQKYYGHTPLYHKIVWESLKKNIAHILIAFYNHIPLAAYELFYFKDVLYYPYGGTSPEYRNVMAPNLLMWEAIRLGKKLGAKYFDMWGSLPPQYNQDHPWTGFSRFKEGYGGTFVQFLGSYDLVINPQIYQIYNFAYKMRETYLNLKRLL